MNEYQVCNEVLELSGSVDRRLRERETKISYYYYQVFLSSTYIILLSLLLSFIRRTL